MSKKASTDFQTLRLFWQASLREKRLLYTAALFPLGAIFIGTVVPLFVGKILGALSNPQSDPMHYVPYFIGAAVIGLTANRYGFSAVLELQARTMSYLQSLAMDTLLKRSVGFHNNTVGGKIVSDTLDFPQAYSMLINALYMSLLPFCLILVVGSAFVFTESWKLGLIITAMAAFALLSGIFESNQRVPLRERRRAATKAVTSHLADSIVNVQTVKTFAGEGRELSQHGQLNKSLLKLRLADWHTAAMQGNRRMIILVGMQLAFILVVIHLVHQDPRLLAIGIFGFSFSITITNRLFEINSMLRTVEDGLLLGGPMTDILLQTVEIQDHDDAKPLRAKNGAVQLDDVSFRYQDSTSDEMVFANLNLNIRSGEKVGLVGPSGGGKSTLTRLLLRFDDITAGSITIDGQNIADVTQSSLREAVAYVPQEPLLFHRSVRENISYGKPGATAAAITAAARSAHADSFITQLPEGYDTLVGERGVKLSGGQRQRVAIAQTILKDAPILVLDEATSALDSESEVHIQKALWELMKGRTALVIAHRLSTIQKMDRIIVLDGGQIVEEGTHSELLKKEGVYAKLWAHQSGGFIEE